MSLHVALHRISGASVNCFHSQGEPHTSLTVFSDNGCITLFFEGHSAEISLIASAINAAVRPPNEVMDAAE